MDASLKETLRRRAGFRCEYCHLPEAIAELPFQFDHIVAAQHGGMPTEDNLAWACARCNRHKGPNLSGIDPESGKLTRLFNPRIDVWAEHFYLERCNPDRADGHRTHYHCRSPNQSSRSQKPTN
jgi:HNH endonuclease